MSVARGERQIDLDDGWDLIYEKTHKNKLKATAKNIRDLLVLDHNISPEQFLSLAPLIVEHGDLEKRCDDVVRRILSPVANDERCFNQLLEYSARLGPVIRNAGDDASDLVEVLREKLEGNPTNLKLRSFAEACGIIENENEEQQEEELNN